MNQLNAHNVIPTTQHQIKDFSWYKFDPNSQIDDVRVNAPTSEDLKYITPTHIDSQTRTIVSSIAVDNILHAQPVYSSIVPESASIPITQPTLSMDREIKIDMPMMDKRELPTQTSVDINKGKSAPQQEWSYEKIQSPMVPKESHKRKLDSWVPDYDVSEERESLLEDDDLEEKQEEILEDSINFDYVPRPEQQRSAEMQRGVLSSTPKDAMILGRWYKLRKELGGKGYLIKPKEFGKLKLKHATPNLYKSYWINRSTPQDIIDMEEKERQDRIARGANPMLLGKLHAINKQLKNNGFSASSDKGFSFNHNIDTDNYKMKRQTKKPLGQWSSQFAWGTYVPRRVPVEIISLEEAEREWRSLKRACPLLLGKVHKVNKQLKSINFVMPTGSNKGSYSRIQKRSLGNNWDNTPITFAWPRSIPSDIIEMEEKERQARMEKGVDAVLLGKWHLIHRELHAVRQFVAPITAEFVMEKTADIAETIVEKGADLVQAVVEEVPIVAEMIKETSSEIAEAVIDRAPSMLENAEHAAYVGAEAAVKVGKFTFGLVGSLYESAMDKLGYVDHASLAYIHAAEEKERMERLNKKVDPMVEAKKAHVQDQLLSMIKTAN